MKRCARGFVLVETLVATMLMAVALGALAHVLVLGVRANVSARSLTLATWLAADKLESLRVEAGGAVDGGEDEELLTVQGVPVEQIDAPAAFVRRWSARRLSIDSDTLLLIVSVAPFTGASASAASTAGVVSLVTIKRTVSP